MQIQETAKLLKLDLSHVKAERIVSGDQEHIASLLELIVAIPKQRSAAGGGKRRSQTGPHEHSLDKGERIGTRASISRRGGGEERKGLPSREAKQHLSEHWESESRESDSSTQNEPFHSRRRDATLQRESASSPPEQIQAGRPVEERKGRRPGLASEGTNVDSSEGQSVHHPVSDGAERGSDSADDSPSSSEFGERIWAPPKSGPSSYAKIHSELRSWGQKDPTPSTPFQPTSHPHPPATAPSNELTRGCASPKPEDESRKSGDVSARGADVSKVLSLVARVAREEQREWERKQAAFGRQLQLISRRAYAARWPFRPLPDARKVLRTADGGVRNWRKQEDERLRKRRKWLVALRPRAGAHVGAGMARCRSAYRSFLPRGQVSVGFVVLALLSGF